MINVIKQKLKPEGTEYQQLLYILHFLILTELNIHQYFQGSLVFSNHSDPEENKPFGLALFSSLKKWGIGQPPGRVWGDMEVMYSLFTENSPFTGVAIGETLDLIRTFDEYTVGVENEIVNHLKLEFQKTNVRFDINLQDLEKKQHENLQAVTVTERYQKFLAKSSKEFQDEKYRRHLLSLSEEHLLDPLGVGKEQGSDFVLSRLYFAIFLCISAQLGMDKYLDSDISNDFRNEDFIIRSFRMAIDKLHRLEKDFIIESPSNIQTGLYIVSSLKFAKELELSEWILGIKNNFRSYDIKYNKEIVKKFIEEYKKYLTNGVDGIEVPKDLVIDWSVLDSVFLENLYSNVI